jgi:hypothetical protein
VIGGRRTETLHIHAAVRGTDGGVTVAVMVARMQRTQAEAHRAIMLFNAARSDAVERRVVAEDALARGTDST